MPPARAGIPLRAAPIRGGGVTETHCRDSGASHDARSGETGAGELREGRADLGKAAELFYGRLFEIAPQVRAMFPDDMTEQRKKLMATLAIVVNGLNNLDADPSRGKRARQTPRRPTARRPRTTRWSGKRCCGRSRKGLGESWTPPVADRLDLRLHDAVRLHDQRGLRPEGRVMFLSPRKQGEGSKSRSAAASVDRNDAVRRVVVQRSWNERTPGGDRQRHGGGAFRRRAVARARSAATRSP